MSRATAVIPLAKFAKVLRAQRRHRRLSQAALARLAGIDQGGIANYELARNAPSPSAMWRLREVLPNLPECQRKSEQVHPVGISRGPQPLDEATIAARPASAQTLIRARLASQLRLVDVEERTGIHVALLSRYETGRETPSARQLTRILAAIGGAS